MNLANDSPIDSLTIGQLKSVMAMLGVPASCPSPAASSNPFIGRRVVVRTYSAGVHIGTLVSATGSQCELADALRLWKWEGGGLSLSAVANDGIKGGRLNRTGSIYLTEAIEFIPTTAQAEDSYVRFIE